MAGSVTKQQHHNNLINVTLKLFFVRAIQAIGVSKNIKRCQEILVFEGVMGRFGPRRQLEVDRSAGGLIPFFFYI